MSSVLKTMTVRLYPNRLQTARFERYLLAGRICFNRALSAAIDWYERRGKMVTYYDHCADLTALRDADSFWSDVPASIQRNALRRLDKAYKAFFRRLKTGQKPGFPRFKGRNRWNSFSIGANFKRLIAGNRIRVSGVDGLVRARNLRPIEGEIKEQCIVRKAGKWFCKLVIDQPASAVVPDELRPVVGIDVGLKAFATLSDGTAIENPRFGRQAERTLRRAHRNVSRTKKGSQNRRKAVARLQRVYLRIQDLRHNFTHQESRRIVNTYSVIAVENLNVKGMVQGRLAKGILDACWSLFTSQLTYKAESAGGVVVRVNPAGTSQECSQCGKTVPKDLSVRVHQCDCGCVLDRDLNAARNIFLRAMSQHPASVGGSVMPVEGSNATPLKQEVLTIG